KLNASNPGQFYYNVFMAASSSPTTLTLNIPYPFITQGAVPIHFYGGVTSVSNPSGSGSCYVPGTATGQDSTHQITFSPTGTIGSTTAVTLAGPAGKVYVNFPLDFGLKGTGSYLPADPLNTGKPDAIHGTSPGDNYNVPYGQTYSVSDSSGGSATVSTENA